MNKEEFVPIIEKLIAQDRLEEAAKDLASFCSNPTKGDSKTRFDYIRTQALLISGKLKNLTHSSKIQGTVNYNDQIVILNKERVALFELIKILNDPTYTLPAIETTTIIQKLKKIGLVALVIYGIFSIVALIGVIFVFRQVLKGGFQNENKPIEIIFQPKDCYLTTGNFITLYANPEIKSPSIGQLLSNKKYKVMEVRKVKLFEGASDHYFFKIYDDDKKWTGWIKEQPMGLEISPDCYVQ